MNVVGLSKVPHLSSDILSTLALEGSVVEDVAAELFPDKVDKFVVAFDSSSRDDDSSGGEGLSLEFLDDVDVEVADVASISLDGISETSSSVGSLVDVVLELLISSQEVLQLMASGVLVHSHTAGDVVFGLKGAICDHAEDIDDIVRQAMGTVITALPGVVHLEGTSCHLSDAVVDSFAGVDGSLEVGVLQRQHGTAALGSLISRSSVNEDAKVDVGRDGD